MQYIDNLSYVADIFGNKRKLNSIEGGNIFFNLKKTILAKSIILGFCQVCKKNDVKKFFNNGLNVANKHISIYTSLLIQDNLKSPSMLDSEVTDSTVAPFSDKLMLYHVGFLFAAATSYYGTAAVASMRADIPAHCETSILRDLKGLAKFGQLMIKHKWLETPPIADDRKNYKTITRNS